MSIDIFHERITLRGVEGDVRTLTLPEFKTETEHGFGTAAAAIEEDELTTETIRPDEISPELMYTAEHQVPALKTTVSSPLPGVPEAGREGESGTKRRRGRRGGRRGRPADDSQGGRKANGADDVGNGGGGDGSSS